MKFRCCCAIFFMFFFSISIVNSSSAKPNLILGQVIDVDNKNPIKDVKVKIEYSGFIAQTDIQGKFSLDYAPGEFRIFFTKVGYFPYPIKLKISEKTYFPLETVELKPAPWLFRDRAPVSAI